jgi:hypothetical protein
MPVELLIIEVVFTLFLVALIIFEEEKVGIND